LSGKLKTENIFIDPNSFRIKKSIIQKLNHTLRENHWQVEVLGLYCKSQMEIIDIRSIKEQKTQQLDSNKRYDSDIFGIALDIGTTTIVSYLVNLTNGEILGSASAVNPQVRVGTDLISRIRYSTKVQRGSTHLKKNLTDTINKLINNLGRQYNIENNTIFQLVVIGNTAMLHSFLGLPITSLGSAPYNPVFSGNRYFDANELDLNINPNGKIYIGPTVAGFMGADAVVSGLITNLVNFGINGKILKNDKLSLLLDIGTNSEILLSNGNRILGCSAAAGPAFEGGNLRFGTRAVSGAVFNVRIKNKKVISKTINRTPPIGITGSGAVDSIAEFLDAGAIFNNGNINRDTEKKWLRYQKKIKIKGATEPSTRCDLILPELCVVPKNKSGLDTSITITQADIREVQLAKAAIRTGIDILIDKLNVKIKDIDQIYLAGAFGNYLNIENAIKIKLLPEIDMKKIRSIGNSAGSGAKLILQSNSAKADAIKLAKKIEYIDLATLESFQDEFINNMNF
jgi:uncharacterized 2Fe-2S/4Fe-4S cluster protein (DUF4445 family)